LFIWERYKSHEQSLQFNGLPRIIGGRDLVAHSIMASVQQEQLDRLSQAVVSVCVQII